MLQQLTWNEKVWGKSLCFSAKTLCEPVLAFTPGIFITFKKNNHVHEWMPVDELLIYLNPWYPSKASHSQTGVRLHGEGQEAVHRGCSLHSTSDHTSHSLEQHRSHHLSLLRGAGSSANWKTAFYHAIYCILAPYEEELWWACCNVGLRWHWRSPCSAETLMPVSIRARVMRGKTTSLSLMKGEALYRTSETSHFCPKALIWDGFPTGSSLLFSLSLPSSAVITNWSFDSSSSCLCIFLTSSPSLRHRTLYTEIYKRK